MLEMRIVASKNFNCDTLSLLLSFLSEIPSVRLVVVVGGIDEHVPSLPSNSQVKLISFAKLLSQGHSDLQPFCPPKPEDIATICYTSGTTGTPNRPSGEVRGDADARAGGASGRDGACGGRGAVSVSGWDWTAGAGSGLRCDGPLSSSGSANPAFLGCWAVVVRPGFKMGYWVVIPLNG
ncbi:Long chain acyl-CoA synthetase 7, peroxisomal [Vitis vinifera]|uniref:Long chain acyl-CoA synthetase 7, peroxisomal n=1 Tax=Vitis vinifera TaxID=29760 RepID=A0A438KCM7_VITVI|nr:Long chain acyl-CoA synthetase 7, peroxisomal [Vitis vinifera]